MNDIHNYAWAGALAGILPALLLLLAGAGWRKLAQGAAISIFLPLLGAAPVAYWAFKIAQSDRGRGGGESAPIGDLVSAVLAFGAAFLLLCAITLYWQIASKRLTLERAPRSLALLVPGGLAVLLAAFCVADITIGFSPRMASTERLIQQLDNQSDSPVGAELVRRGPPVVPVIVAALRRPLKPNEPEYVAAGQQALLLRVLIRIGGPEATAEIRRWSARCVSAEVRAVAIDGLASQGDRSVIPLIVEMLGAHSPSSGARRPELFHALGALKAADQVGLIRSVLFDDPGNTFFNIRPAVAALAAIDTDQAWGVISELASSKDASLASETMVALQQCHGPRTVAFLSKILDDPDPKRSREAYEALVWAERSLFPDRASWSWSEANAEKLRAALNKRAANGPEH